MPNPPPGTPQPNGNPGGIDWNPISWAKSAISDITGSVTPVYKWVVKQITKAVGLVENDIAKVRSYLSTAIDEVGNGISWIVTEVNRLSNAIGSGIDSAIHSAEHFAETIAKDAVAPVIKAVDTAWHHADNLFHSAETAADHAINFFYDHTIKPAIHDLDAGIGDVEKAWDKALKDFHNDIVKPIEHDVDEALAEAKKAIYFIDHSGLDVVHIVDECWDWMKAFAAHPVAAIEALPKDIVNELSPAWALRQVEDNPSIYGTVGAALAKEFDKQWPPKTP